MWDKNPRFGRDVHAEPPWKWGNKQEKSAIFKKNLENGWLFRHITNIEYACYQWTSSLCARLLAFSTSDSSQLFERKNSRQNPLEKLRLSVSKSRAKRGNINNDASKNNIRRKPAFWSSFSCFLRESFPRHSILGGLGGLGGAAYSLPLTAYNLQPTAAIARG